MADIIKSVRDEGWNARMTGKGTSANPYPRPSIERGLWLDGWTAANFALLATMTQEPDIDGEQ